MYANNYQDWGYYYSSVLVILLGEQFLKIVTGLISIIVGRDAYINNENPIDSEVIYCPNSNDLART